MFKRTRIEIQKRKLKKPPSDRVIISGAGNNVQFPSRSH